MNNQQKTAFVALNILCDYFKQKTIYIIPHKGNTTNEFLSYCNSMSEMIVASIICTNF
jgi:hypothetical protein